MFTQSTNKDILQIRGPIDLNSWGFLSFDEYAAYDFFRRSENFDKDLDVIIASPGGDLTLAKDIKAQIEKYKGNVNIYITSVAASAATVIACAKNAKVTMATGSMFMIHNPSTFSYGDANATEKAAQLLRKEESNLVDIYAEKLTTTGKKADKNKLLEMINSETWLTAEEALAYGFIDNTESLTNINVTVDDNKMTIDDSKTISVFNFANSTSLNNFLKTHHITNTHTSDKFNLVDNTMRGTMSNIEKSKHQEEVTPVVENIAVNTKDNKKDEIKVITNSQELAQAYPELIKNIVKTAQEQERERLKSLDNIAHTMTKEDLYSAKYERMLNAKDAAYEAVLKQKDTIHNAARNAIADSQELNTVVNGTIADTKEDIDRRLVNSILDKMKDF